MMLFSLKAILRDLGRVCQEITSYYTEERYPFFVSEPSKEEIAEALAMAKELVKMILEKIKYHYIT